MSLLKLTKSQDAVSSQKRASRNDQTVAVKELENTIAGFQAILTDDDRKKLQDLKATPHDAQSIIMFTAELDRIDSNRRGKSVASRLASFLQTIEQFSPIVDTYIQSNPDIAALIWGSVKFTFQILANVTSYFVSFVEQLYGFGSLCSRFAEYQVVFSDSPRLKDSICEFHTAVITCCKNIIVEIRRPLKSKAWKMLTESFQSQIRGYVDDIKSKAESVRDDIQLAKAQNDRVEQQRQAKEREEAAGSRKHLSAWFSKSMSEMKAIGDHGAKTAAEQQRHRLLKALSSFNYTAAFNSIRNRRHLGTAEWIFRTDEFQNWLQSDISGVLHITGKIGSGKTVLASSVVERLCQQRKPEQFVSFFFSQFDNSSSLTADTIIRSIVQQLLSSIGTPKESVDTPLTSDLDACLRSAQSDFFSLKALEKLYEIASAIPSEWFIVLDGVNECARDEQSHLLRFFCQLMGNLPPSRRFKLLISGRETTIQQVNQLFNTRWRLVTGSRHTSADIVAYAEDVIEAKQLSGELVVRDSHVIEEVLETIAAKEEGMFLWAFLTIEVICSKNTDADIRKALEDIPTDLPATFDRALGRIVQRRNHKIAKDIFSWTAAVRQPLTLPQLQEALSVKVGQKKLDPDNLISGMDRIAIWCENLVCVEETDGTVHFSHHSIREFLLTPGLGEYQDFHLNMDKCDLGIGEICITYLNLESFRTALVETHRNDPPVALNIDMGELAEQTVYTAVKGSMGPRIGRLASRVVRPMFRPSNTEAKDTTMSIQAPVLDTPPPPNILHFPFFEYAAKYWFHHRTCLDGMTEKNTWNFLGKILRSPHHALKLPWMDRLMQQHLVNYICSKLYPCNRRFTERLKSICLDPEEDEIAVQNLTFAIIYASVSGNWGLACRAFMILAQVSCEKYITMPLIQLMVADGHHNSCPNNCLLKAQSFLDRGTLVSAVTRAFAIVTCGQSQTEAPMFIELCRKLGLEPGALFYARTSTHRSIIGLAAEKSSTDRILLIKSFFEYFRRRVPDPSQWNRWSLATSGLCSALRHGVSTTTELLLEQCLNEGGLDLGNKESVIAVLSDTIKFFWLPETSKSIVTMFFGETVKPSLKSYRKILFEKCVMSNNWKFAAALVDLEPSLGAGYESGQWFHFLTEILSCQKCRERTQAGIEDVGVLEVSRNAYRMCSSRATKSRSVEGSPHTALDLLKGTLRWDAAGLKWCT